MPAPQLQYDNDGTPSVLRKTVVYTDYLKKHGKQERWKKNPRFEALHMFCKEHTAVANYQKYFDKWTDEEMANCAICLCHMVDRQWIPTSAAKTMSLLPRAVFVSA